MHLGAVQFSHSTAASNANGAVVRATFEKIYSFRREK